MIRTLRATCFTILPVLVFIFGCGDSSAITEEQAADLIIDRILSTSEQEGVRSADCARSDDGSRIFDCRVEPFIWSDASATIAIAVPESGDTVVVKECKALKAESKELEEIRLDPCRVIR